MSEYFVKDVIDMTFEEMAEEFLKIKDLKERESSLKNELMQEVRDNGNYIDEKHRKYVHGDYQAEIEKRTSFAISNMKKTVDEVSKVSTDMVKVSSSISVKEGIDINSIPSELIGEINKYFDITVENEVDIKDLKKLLSKGRITQEFFNSVVTETTTEALKVGLNA